MAEPVTGQVACSVPSTMLRYIRSSFGDDAATELLRIADLPYTAAFLDDVSNWIWYHEAVTLFEAAAEVSGDPRIGCRVGEETVRQHAGTPVATLFRSLGSPQAIFEQLALAVTKFSTVTALEPTEVAPGRVVVRAKARAGYKRNRHLCDYTAGLLSQPPVLFGLPPAEVVETQCEVRGDDHCLYVATWDAEGAERATDPQQLVTALENQLAAMRDRLDSMYATAKDLIALDDLDVALGRITDRAATAVRAPKYLLAVRTAPGEPLQVHHRGFGDEDPTAAAQTLIDAVDPHAEGGSLIAEVASATRHYGRLMAKSPTGAFFPHERDLLAVYASYAATVLDTATALDKARRESARSHALLQLSRSLAVATTSGEVAQQLAQALPAMVDCDQVDIYLWDEEEQVLTCQIAAELAHEARAGLRVRVEDSAHLARLVANPDATPIFLDPDTADEFVASTLREFGAEAVVVAPIVAHGRLYGTLSVSVSDRPERLRSTPDLRDRLAGVVAQASTALDNARLIETMDHQARHDNLTGLLGHRAFHDSLRESLSEDDVFTLATFDIDDFKAINDRFGHPVGDDALVRVAHALRASVRAGDTVFRVGGEEFGVLLHGVSSDDALPAVERLRDAVAEIDFVMPLRVSVGLASWPLDAPDTGRLIERADAALYAAKRSGKDCTRIFAAAHAV